MTPSASLTTRRPAQAAAAQAAAARAARAAALFHALSDETRIGILQMLRGGERCVCDLQDGLDAAQSRLSFHLKVLKDAGIVVDRREGRWAYYAIAPDALQDAHDVVRELATPTRRRGLQVLGECCG